MTTAYAARLRRNGNITTVNISAVTEADALAILQDFIPEDAEILDFYPVTLEPSL